jgi:hypothetical protein
MAFVSVDGVSATNPNLGNDVSHLVLACPSVPNALVLDNFREGTPYDRRKEGWAKQDGRSLTGANRILANRYPFRPSIMTASFLIKLPMADLFDQLLEAQEAGGYITIQDWFVGGTAALYWIAVDNQYISLDPEFPLAWRRLQFTAFQEV